MLNIVECVIEGYKIDIFVVGVICNIFILIILWFFVCFILVSCYLLVNVFDYYWKLVELDRESNC